VQRLALGVEYVGTGFAGWQRQPGAPTIEAEVARAIGHVAAHDVSLVCGGRTDAGVHAIGQVAHFETGATRSMRSWALGANAVLPPSIAIRWVLPVPGWFHARFSALRRRYRYRILNSPTRSAFAAHRAAWVRAPLDVLAMRSAAALLVGEHDFSAFRAAACQSRSPVRRIDTIAVELDGEWLHVDVAANAFLHHMVRNIAGVLIAVGRGERTPAWAGEVLAGRDRRLAAPTAPAEGLCLLSITYPDAFGLAAAGHAGERAEPVRSAMIRDATGGFGP
jgi:tRNA pseudouridine38-40 synthase